MKNNILINLIILLGLLGCANGFKTEFIYIDSAFQSYVDLFKELTNKPVNVSLVFNSNLEQNRVGLCWRTNGLGDRIEIDPDYWKSISEAGKEQLILHELGHCVLGLGHNDQLGQVGEWRNVPLSIMHSIHFGDYLFYLENREYYLKEFTK